MLTPDDVRTLSNAVRLCHRVGIDLAVQNRDYSTVLIIQDRAVDKELGIQVSRIDLAWDYGSVEDHVGALARAVNEHMRQEEARHGLE